MNEAKKQNLRYKNLVGADEKNIIIESELK